MKEKKMTHIKTCFHLKQNVANIYLYIYLLSVVFSNGTFIKSIIERIPYLRK